MLSGAGSYTTLTFGGRIAAEGFGLSQFSAGGTGGNGVQLRNTTAGTGNYTRLALGNDATTDAFLIEAYSSTYTTSGPSVQDGAVLYGARAGGLSLAAAHASGVLRFYAGGTTERVRIDTDGQLLIGDGAGDAPALSFLNDTDSGFYRTGSVLYLSIDAQSRFAFGSPGGTLGNNLTVFNGSHGAGAHAGSTIYIGSNLSGSGAAGYLEMQQANGGNNQLWVDGSGNLRISTGGAPQEDGSPSDTSGSVVGTQSSTRDAKDIVSTFTDNDAALQTILDAPLFRFTYKSGAYNRTQFLGITTEDSPEFSMDEGRSFNPISACGYLMAAVKALAARVAALEAAL
jgi:hypothetical protein